MPIDINEFLERVKDENIINLNEKQHFKRIIYKIYVDTGLECLDLESVVFTIKFYLYYKRKKIVKEDLIRSTIEAMYTVQNGCIYATEYPRKNVHNRKYSIWSFIYLVHAYCDKHTLYLNEELYNLLKDYFTRGVTIYNITALARSAVRIGAMVKVIRYNTSRRGNIISRPLWGLCYCEDYLRQSPFFRKREGHKVYEEVVNAQVTDNELA